MMKGVEKVDEVTSEVFICKLLLHETREIIDLSQLIN